MKRSHVTSLVRTVARSLRARRRRLGEMGMATAEYAVVTVAACGFAGLLLAIVRSPEVRGLLLGIIKRALSV
jgi:prepilin signal peptidase PulO-like enzyme (type II secretory pathway)